MNQFNRSKNRIARFSRRRRCRRSGITLVELTVAVAVLTTVMTFSTTLSIRLRQVWKDVRQQRIAVNELSNQLESFTRLSPAQAERQLQTIQPSEVCQQTLAEAKLTGTLLEDDLGSRVVLSIQWQRRHPGKTIQLAGWLEASPIRSAQQRESEKENTQ